MVQNISEIGMLWHPFNTDWLQQTNVDKLITHNRRSTKKGKSTRKSVSEQPQEGSSGSSDLANSDRVSLLTFCTLIRFLTCVICHSFFPLPEIHFFFRCAHW